MNINIINPFQGLQNAYRPGSEKTGGENYGPVASTDQSLEIHAHVSNLQATLNDLNVVHDPPFFPIATYQRVDLIVKVRRIQTEIGQSALPPELKQAVSDKLKNSATDKELGDAIGKLFAIRHTLTKARTVSAKNTGSGSSLAIKA